MKYHILKCSKCGGIDAYAFGIRGKCRTCNKKIDLKKCIRLYECSGPQDAGYMLRAIKLEMARKNGVMLEKGANYINLEGKK